MWALISSSSRGAWEQPVVKWRAVVHALRSVCSKNGSALECSWATPFPAPVKKVIYLVFGGLSARAWDFIGCNLILNCSATYTFHSRGGDTRRGSSIKGWQACQSSVPAVFKHQLYKCAVSVKRSREYKYGIPCMQCTQAEERWKQERQKVDFHVDVELMDLWRSQVLVFSSDRKVSFQHKKMTFSDYILHSHPFLAGCKLKCCINSCLPHSCKSSVLSADHQLILSFLLVTKQS